MRKNLTIIMVTILFGFLSMGISSATDAKKEGYQKHNKKYGQNYQDAHKDRSAMDLPRQTKTTGEVIGKALANNQGKELGEISDILTAPDGRLHPVPYDMVQTDSLNSDEMIAQVSSDTFNRSASFAYDSTPDLVNQRWEAKINAFYGDDQTRDEEMMDKK